jgi:hypothetical protein
MPKRETSPSLVWAFTLWNAFVLVLYLMWVVLKELKS